MMFVFKRLIEGLSKLDYVEHHCSY